MSHDQKQSLGKGTVPRYIPPFRRRQETTAAPPTNTYVTAGAASTSSASSPSTVAAKPVPASVTCESCAGTGKMKITVSDFFASIAGKAGEPVVITCVRCEGTGVLTPRQQKLLEFERNMWCRCSGGENGVYYHGNNPKPTGAWCVCKHHWHCARCRKITQIG